VTRLVLAACIATMMLGCAAGEAQADRARHDRAAAPHGHTSLRQAAPARIAAIDPVVFATAVAERYWGAVPCGGQVSVLAAQPLVAGMEPTTDGWVTFESSLGANDLQAPANTYSGCTISLAAWQWPTKVLMAEDWNMFCLTVVHEMGHLLGHPHSLVPGSVMAPVFTDESSVPAICRDARSRVQASAETAAVR
jgi:hypothetical protein